MREPGKVGVVTVTYNSEAVIPDFMTSLLAQSYSNFRLFVVDNASSDNSIPAIQNRSDDRVVIIQNGDNRGVAEANNQGIQAALAESCDSIILLNNDTVFGPGLFANLVAGLDGFDCDIVAPKMLYFDDPQRIWAAGGAFQRWLGYRIKHYGKDQIDRGQFDTGRISTYVPTCCILMRATVIQRVGFMDPAYFVYFDDVDFMYRAMLAGVTLRYVSDASLLHKVSSCTGGAETSFARYYCARNRAYFLRKHVAPPEWCVYAGMYLVYYLLLRLTGRDDTAGWKLKTTSFLTGLGMAGNSGSTPTQFHLDRQ